MNKKIMLWGLILGIITIIIFAKNSIKTKGDTSETIGNTNVSQV